MSSYSVQAWTNSRRYSKQCDEEDESILITVIASKLSNVCRVNDRFTCPSPLFQSQSGVKPVISIKDYLGRIYLHAGCSESCFVLALAYLDRLRVNSPGFVVNSLNIHRLLLAGIVVAAKCVDDSHYRNALYARVGGISVQEMNQLELDFLFLTGFDLNVLPEDYKEYHDDLVHHAAMVGLYLPHFQIVSTPAPATPIPATFKSRIDFSGINKNKAAPSESPSAVSYAASTTEHSVYSSTAASSPSICQSTYGASEQSSPSVSQLEDEQPTLYSTDEPDETSHGASSVSLPAPSRNMSRRASVNHSTLTVVIESPQGERSRKNSLDSERRISAEQSPFIQGDSTIPLLPDSNGIWSSPVQHPNTPDSANSSAEPLNTPISSPAPTEEEPAAEFYEEPSQLSTYWRSNEESEVDDTSDAKPKDSSISEHSPEDDEDDDTGAHALFVRQINYMYSLFGSS